MASYKFPIPYVNITGSHRQRGIQHGKQCAELIRKNLDICKTICLRFRKYNESDLWNETRRFIKPLKKYDPLLLDEMDGIAEGSGLSLEEIVFLNTRTEIMQPMWKKASIREGCTSLIVTDPLCDKKRIYAAQTWDWISAAEVVQILLHSTDETGRQFITITEAGIIGSMGVNNRGVVVLLNFLSVYDVNAKGTPYHILLRRALDSDSLFQAQRNLLRSPIAHALNALLADRSGDAMGLELTSTGSDIYTPTNGLMLHTNHIVSDYLRVREGMDQRDDSLARYQTALRSLSSVKQLTEKDIINLFSTHKNELFSICRHPNLNAPEPMYTASTLFSVIFEMTEEVMFLATGLACKSEFQRHDLKILFCK